MTPEKWQQVKELVSQALELSPNERISFLSNICSDDPSLLEEVKLLLSTEEELSGFLETPLHKLVNVEENSSTIAYHTESIAQKVSTRGLNVGECFLDKYNILRLIGQGGMGQVYQASHTTLATMVAIKVLNNTFAQDTDAVERFKREARTSAQIEHPNTVRVFDYGAQDTTCYLVMEYLEGESLRDRLKKQKRIPLSELIPFMRQVCSAIGFFHSKGVIHRDLKPDNIFFQSYQGQEIVKILDFGIAKPNSLTQGGETLTNPGSICGTPFYMSPEQCQGKKISLRSDIYSLGVILYEMLTGRKPFEAEGTLGIMFSHVNTLPPNLHEIAPDIPKEVANVVMRCLSKDPNKRYKSAEELLQVFSDAVVSNSNPTFFSKIAPKYYLLVLLIALVIVGLWSKLFHTNPNNIEVSKDKKTAKLLSEIIGNDFVLIPANKTTIGSNLIDCSQIPGCKIAEDESPSHIVELSSYYLSKYEITNREYREFIIATGQKSPSHWKENTFPIGGEDIPITNISWNEATAYCEWRSNRDHINFRLPTEEEWEHAARGDDARFFPWGDNWDNIFANANKDYTNSNSPLSIKQSPNNTYDKSPFGIFAMAGNVREWTSSDFKVYSGSKYVPKGKDLECKVLRGGSFLVVPNGLRTTFRAWKLSSDSDIDVGFRLAATP